MKRFLSSYGETILIVLLHSAEYVSQICIHLSIGKNWTMGNEFKFKWIKQQQQKKEKEDQQLFASNRHFYCIQ